MKTPSFIPSITRLIIASLGNLEGISPLKRFSIRSLFPDTVVSALTSFAGATCGATRKTALALFSVVVLLASGGATVRGQSALDGFDPNANGIVQVVVVQPDGKILIGGDFTIVLGIARNRIARLNSDGTLDQFFDPSANGYVNTMTVLADGKILLGGSFSIIGGQTRNRIARLDGTTGQADSFDPNANGIVRSVAVQANGKILAGGEFSNIGGQARNRMARLDAATGFADSFDPAVGGLAVEVIVVQADGRILVGGTFGSIGGQTRNHIARLDATNGLADSFNPNPTSGFYVVTAIALQADGKILAGGTFTTIGGQTRNSIARLDATTGLADSFNPSANNIVRSIAVQTDGQILAGGDFTIIGGQTLNHIARLDANTGLAVSFDPNASGNINAIAVQADGKILAGGDFTTLGPNGQPAITRNRIARLETDGRLDQTFNLNIRDGSRVYATAVQSDGKILVGGFLAGTFGVDSSGLERYNPDGGADSFSANMDSDVYAIAVQADGKILVGGDFFFIHGKIRENLARLDSDGDTDTAFDPQANGAVNAIALQPDGKILVAGDFTAFSPNGGTAVQRRHIARLNSDGTVDPAFDPNANGSVFTIARQADGKILVGGLFSGPNSIGGQTRNRIARLDAITGLADSWNPNATGAVYSLAIQPDGKILVGGDFFGVNSIGGQTRSRIARLDPISGLADSFDPSAQDIVHSIAVQADGKILVGGRFSGTNSIGGQARNRIARLEPTIGLADVAFDPNVSGAPPGWVYSIAVQADGRVLVGGLFTSIGGQSRKYIARLSNDTGALQNLAVSQNAIAWTRGGSSPQFPRTTFESSTDNVNYAPLGNGTASGSAWTLTGLNLPTGQNLYIRARGYYRTGYNNGSESHVESVRNVFLSLAPTPTQVVSRKLHNGTPFDIVLPLTGNFGIESRSGAMNDYQVVFTFLGSVTFTNAAVTVGSGSVSSATGSGTSIATVNLTGVTNAQRIAVTLSGVNNGIGAGDVSVQMGVLVGDTNGDGFVNSGDTTQTRSRSGQAAGATNFRSDVNIDGTINSGDSTVVRARSGTFLP